MTADQHIEQMIGSIVGQLAIAKATLDSKDQEIAQLKAQLQAATVDGTESAKT